MASVIQEKYESLTYPHFVHGLTDPDRLAVIGTILGLTPPPVNPKAARVLDLGCGSGTSLLAFAERSPKGRFLGVDFSGPDITTARSLVAEAKLTNIEFHQADLLTWQPPKEKFDYIISYGFFSWVPDAVKDRLLALIGQCLAPGGIAIVSYITYPGSRQEESIRDLLQLRTAGLTNPAQIVAAAHQTLDFFDRAWAGMETLPHANHLRHQAKQTRAKLPHSLLLDDLGVERDPCYLLQFVSWAAEHGLAYLGDAEFNTMLLENLPSETARELLAMKLDRLQTEQMLDYIVNRQFRCTLLVQQDTAAAVSTGMNAAAMPDFCFSPKLEWATRAAPEAAVGLFKTRSDSPVSLRSAPLVGFVGAMIDRPNAFTPYSTLLESAERSAGRTFTADQRSQLCRNLLTLYGRSQLDLSFCAVQAPHSNLPTRPKLSQLNRAFASRRSIMVNGLNQKFELTPDQKFFTKLLDGTRSLAKLKSACAGKPIANQYDAFLQEMNAKGFFIN